GGRRVENRTPPIPAGTREHRDQRLDRLLPHVPPLPDTTAEGMGLDRPLPLPEAELDAAAGEEVERRDPLGDADRMVRRELDDAMAQSDPLGPLAGGPEEDLGRGGMGVLLEEVVLDHPGVVVAEPVRELNLGERVLEDLV